MYTLRIIESNGAQTNVNLGNGYVHIDRFACPEFFRREYLEFFGKQHVADLDDEADVDSVETHGFVVSEDGYLFALGKSKYYIMTESGQTFSNLTRK